MVSEQVSELRGQLEQMGAEHKAIGDGMTQIVHGGVTWHVRRGPQGFRAECITPLTMDQVLHMVFAHGGLPVPARYERAANGDFDVTCPSCGVEITYSEVPLPGYCQRCGQALMYGDEGQRFDVSSPKDVSIRDIVSAWLARHGFHGLFNPDAECGCDLHDLMACGEPDERRCLPAYRHDCTTCDVGCWRAAIAKSDDYMMDGSKDGCECRELESCRDVD